MVEQLEKLLILNDEPEFSVCDDTKVSAEFFILCEENAETDLSKDVFDCRLCGMSILNWVVRACLNQPKVLRVQVGADALDAIRPYINRDVDYSVVFYANTPLLNRTHIKDLLGFVYRKGMNACKLKRGYVFRNDYIKDNDEIYSIDTYDFSSNDFFEVKTHENLAFAREVLSEKIMSYHRKNGVYFENEKYLSIDANTEIGSESEIFSNATIGNGTKIGNNSKIGKNATIYGSKIGNNVRLGVQTIVINSIIKDGTLVENGAVVINSVIGENCRIGWSAKLVETSLKDNATIERLVLSDNARIGEKAVVKKLTELIGVKEKVVIGSNCEIGAKCMIVDSVVGPNNNVPPFTTIKCRVGK